MATANQHLGRTEGVGIGIETTRGTAVPPAATGWMRWLEQDLGNTTEVITNESAIGVAAAVSDSEVVKQFAQGKLGGKITDVVFGYLLTGFFGTPVTTGTSPYVHTFSMNNSSVPSPSLTFSIPKAIDAMRHAYGVIDSLEIAVEQGGWLTFDAAVKARVGTSQSDSIAIATETEFTSKHCSVKIAANTAGLGAAPVLSVLKASIKADRPSDDFAPVGTDTLVEFDRKEFKATAEITVRHTDDQYNADFLANTIKAFQFSAVNGTKSLVLTASRARYRELSRSTGRDDIVTQTIAIEFEFDPAAGYQLIQPVLTNAKTNYTS